MTEHLIPITKQPVFMFARGGWYDDPWHLVPYNSDGLGTAICGARACPDTAWAATAITLGEDAPICPICDEIDMERRAARQVAAMGEARERCR